MNSLFALAFTFLPFVYGTTEVKMNIETAKINFVADMQNTTGTVGGLIATIKFDPNDLANSTISGTVDVNTLDTETPKRDEHLKSADYFDAAKYPTMSFSSTGFTAKGDQFVMTGKMKIKDVEREESISFSFKSNTYKGECTIQAANYNLGNFSKKKPEETNVKISFVISGV